MQFEPLKINHEELVIKSFDFYLLTEIEEGVNVSYIGSTKSTQ